jgi:hypothetical protein
LRPVAELLAQLRDGCRQLDRHAGDAVGVRHDGARHDDTAGERAVLDGGKLDARRLDLIVRQPDAGPLILAGLRVRVAFRSTLLGIAGVSGTLQRGRTRDQVDGVVNRLGNLRVQTCDRDAAGGGKGCYC